MFLRTPYAQTTAAKWPSGLQGKAILFSICCGNICQFKRAVFPQCEFQYGQVASYIKNQNQVCSLMSMFPRTPIAQTVAAEWLYDVKGNNVSICWRNIFFNFNEPFFWQYVFDSSPVLWGCVGMVAQEYILISMFPSTPYAQPAAAEWLLDIKWKAILFSICWGNIFQFKLAIFPQCEFQYIRVVSYIKNQNQVCSLVSMLPRTPAAQTAAAEWLWGIKWKAILFAFCCGNIFQFYEPFFHKVSFNIVQVIWDIKNQLCSLISMFKRMPDAQTAAAERLRDIVWKTILFYICWRNICQF